jgi:endonuclease YncB( thermonuclease family)
MSGRSHFRSALAAALLVQAPIVALAAEGGCGPGAARAEVGKVASLGEGGMFVLENGQTIRLSGIAVPAGESSYGEQARAALERLLDGRAVALAHVGSPDRYARLPAQVYVGEGGETVWVQERLIAQGLARVQPSENGRACASALLAREDTARKAKLGLWASPHFAVRAADDPEALYRYLDTFQIVEGEVLSTGAAGRRVYLNFGRRWKTDFTGVIAAGDLDRFAAAGILPLKLPDRRVRLRGWILDQDGPMMVLDHPEQIELIDDGDKHE